MTTLPTSAPPGEEPQPVSWLNIACALFPNSRPMTREERREFDKLMSRDLEPITFTDDAA